MSSPVLKKVPFTPDLLPKLVTFSCGTEEWQAEVSDWLKLPPGEGGAADEVADGGRVWLYYNENGEVVGVGSLGVTLQRHPGTGVENTPASVIPYVGLDTKFQGKGYSTPILRDLLAEAMADAEQRPIVVLQVHYGNQAAERLYRDKYGFTDISDYQPDPQTGRIYKWMGLALTPAGV